MGIDLKPSTLQTGTCHTEPLGTHLLWTGGKYISHMIYIQVMDRTVKKKKKDFRAIEEVFKCWGVGVVAKLID